jgi:hypothetical protein
MHEKDRATIKESRENERPASQWANFASVSTLSPRDSERSSR